MSNKIQENPVPASRAPFWKNPINVLLLAGVVVLGGVTVQRFFFGEGRAAVNEVVRPGGLLGKGLPPAEEVEAFFKDKAGTVAVDRGFDADPGEICGNGKSYFWTSKPPKKPDPPGWKPPPRPGQDPSYQGPDPNAPFRESPYAMPSSKDILARAPLRDENDPMMAEELRRALARAPGKVGVLASGGLKERFAEHRVRAVTLAESRFEGDDDETVARSLLAEGVAFVLVDRTRPLVRPWIEERLSSVRLRLRDGLSLGWFHPVVLGSADALYRVAPPVVIDAATKRRLTTRVRSTLEGRVPEAATAELALDGVGLDRHRVIVSLRSRVESGLKGRKALKRLGEGPTLVAALDDATAEIKEDWISARKRVISDLGVELPAELAKAMPRMEVEIDVLHDVCALTDRKPRNMLWYLELGLEGLWIEKGAKFAWLEPSYGLHMEVDNEVTFLERTLEKNGFDQFLREPKKAKTKKKKNVVLWETPWQADTEHRFGRFRAVSWIERPGASDIVELYRGIPLKTIWDVSRASLVRSLQQGAEWLMRNQSPDGQYAYKYDPMNKPGRRWSAGGNIVRHALNPYTLLMVNKIAPDPKLVESAKRGIAFTLSFLRTEGSRCVVCHRDPPARYYNAKIGTVAVTILSILKYGDVAPIKDYEDVLRCLGEELLYMQDPNGHFWQYDVPPDHPYYGAESTIAPGEIIFALGRLYTYFHDKKYKDAVDRALPYYMTAWRTLEKQRTVEGIYDEEHRVNLIGIIPWLVTALDDLYKSTREIRYANLGLELQDWIDHEFFWYLARSNYPDYVGASFKTHRELPAINSCQYIEGAAAAYDLAKLVGRNEELRRQVVVHGVRFCLQLQYDGYDNTFYLPVPEEAMGGYRYHLGQTRLRNDYSYHAMAAIAQAVDYLEPDDYPAERPLRVPGTLRELLGGQPGPLVDAPRRPRPLPPPVVPAAPVPR